MKMHLNLAKSIRIVSTLLALPLVVAGVTAPCRAQTLTTIHTFDSTDGSLPADALTQGTNGKLFGTTLFGGVNNDGTVVTITPSGTLAVLHSFAGTDGRAVYGGLIQATNGSFYGTTSEDGANNQGTVFKITASGALTTLYNFCAQPSCTDGAEPLAGLVQATNGNLYGTTFNGGANNEGTVFKITPSGVLTTLHSFNVTDGSDVLSGLIQGTDGNFYGTTAAGGANGQGSIYKITPGGVLTTLHSFDVTDGQSPHAVLVQASNGNFYGTTYSGGASDDGTVFRITSAGALTTLHSFTGDNGDGDGSVAALIQATDGNFYGATGGGGANNGGTIFKITPTGTLTVLYNLCSGACFDGADPERALVQDTNGTLYGTTATGGSAGFGTVFSLSVGLGPFVSTQTTSGAEGAVVNILGTTLTGASSVTFGGIAATFTVLSASEITTTVPAGALTGSVKVTIHATTLTSAQSFRVTPTITSFSPTSGPVGTPITITGTGLMQTTKVTFNNTVATFTVNSDTQVRATVPTGATTGKISITTPGGTVTSTGTFTVN
jgi:uncharacterized repeat protein (TIGR03803 family)